MDVNDSGTVKLGEVCMFYYIKYFEKFIKINNLFISRHGWCCIRTQYATIYLFQICSTQ